jgi:uncharacterized membrane protein required for colicin V production
MDQTYELIDRVTRGLIAKHLLASLTWIDWSVIAFIFIGLFYGMKKGLMREIAVVFEMFIVTYIVFQYYGPLADFLESRIPALSSVYAGAVVYVVILAALFFILRLVDSILQKWLKTTLVAPLRILGGAILGVVHFLILLSLLTQTVLLMPVQPVRKVFTPGNSYFGYQVSKLAPDIHAGMQQAVEFFTLQFQTAKKS